MTEKNLYVFHTRKRWVGDVKNHILRFRNSKIVKDISSFYGNTGFLNINDHEINLAADEVDYSIENARKEISVRINQSKFRMEVLKNFNSMCCLTKTSETALLVASHIIPWAINIETRLDPRNGLCLSILYDKLFDSGYFTFDEKHIVVITKKVENLSDETKLQLLRVSNLKMNTPAFYGISAEALEFHRENIFEKY
ncbi:HNH endonuclease [Flagellimonas sp. S174]|uniref:HNH endonuclease n=1 Tax=Flagellimonas sp. S174 TaxID=3410790 RepID=UPI003BF60D7D